MHYKFVFVILTYREYKDLVPLIESIRNRIQKSFKIIVVNSYYNDFTMKKIETISKMYNIDFINIPNKGYSFGNNTGILHALSTYSFEYLVISNPDIVIDKFDVSILKNTKSIYCGEIQNLKNKKQNPMLIKNNQLSSYLIYYGYKKSKNMYVYIGILINKISRCFFHLFIKIKNKTLYQIYQPHGSFVIFGKNALENIVPIFDENMFLFSEEGVIAVKASEKNINIYFTSQIKCLHKEDASISLWNGNIKEENRKANIYFYEKYIKRGNVD